LFGLTSLAAALAITNDTAQAEKYSPPTASIVVDGNSGAVLQASNPDALRHPASLTKIMTLYLLFERLEAGNFKLDNMLTVSEHASEQAPTKLGLKPGQTIAIEDAIKAIVTKSANDAAVAIAENLGGDESRFAKLMTQKAHDLGMTRTTYTNASGLPDDAQITTARDQALLGRHIQKRFPRYYKYFSTQSFVYHGATLRNHNHLLGSIEGVDGIKTGFTRASGFNLVTSVHRDGRYIVAVVMGGRSSLERDAHMRELISAQIKEAALKRVVPAIAKSNRREETQPALAYVRVASQGNPLDPIQPQTASTFQTPVQSASLAPTPSQPSAPVAARWLTPARPDDAPMSVPATAVIEKGTLPLTPGDPTVPSQPRLLETITFQATPVQSASLALKPAPVPVTANAPQPSAQVEARWLPPEPTTDAPMSAPATTVIEKSNLPLSRGASTVPNQPRLVKTIAIHSGPVQSASLAPRVPDAAAAPQPSTQVAARWLPPVPPTGPSRTIVASAERMPIAQSPAQAAPAFSEPAKLEPEKIAAAKLAGERVEQGEVESAIAPVRLKSAASVPYTPPHADSRWLIQIGAFDREDEARQHLSMARLKMHDALVTARPLTERVQQGDKVLYRARITGFNKEKAGAACQQLRRSDIECIALRN
jgi:D-alanyl-D-alanine carboxypeptidase